MTEILVRTPELRQASEQLKASAKKIGIALQAIDNDIRALKGEKFLGNRASAVQAHYAPKRESLLKAQNIVAHFAEDLQAVAGRFENADRVGSSQPVGPNRPIFNPQKPPEPVDDENFHIKPDPTNNPPQGVQPLTPPNSPKDTALGRKIIDLIDDMDVAKNYLPKNGNTYCNIFVMDFCKKMGIPLPQDLDWDKDGRIDDSLNANEAFSWLSGTYNKGGVQTGAQLGWQTITADQAAQYASEGKVVVAGWQNPDPGQPGHMAIVRPESTLGNIQIAQAGGSNFEQGSITDGFGNRDVSYFVYIP